MRITNKRFAGRDFKAVQIVPIGWRLKYIAVLIVFATLIIWLYPKMYRKAIEGETAYYLLMIPFLLVLIFFLSRVALRIVVYTDPKDRQFVVVKAGLFMSKETLNTGTSNIKNVATETKMVREENEDSGKMEVKSKTSLVVETEKGKTILWTYASAAVAQKAARLIEELLKFSIVETNLPEKSGQS